VGLLDAFAFIDVALAIERQVQAVLGEQHMSEQRGTCTAARDPMGGRWRFVIASRARREILADVLDHFPLPRNELRRNSKTAPTLARLCLETGLLTEFLRRS